MAYRTYSQVHYIIDPNPGPGDFTTISACCSVLTANNITGKVIGIKAASYVESPVLAPGNTYVALGGTSSNVIIVGTVSIPSSGFTELYGIQFNSNGNYALNVTGNGLVYFDYCTFNAINFSCYLDSGSCSVFIKNCSGGVGAPGLTHFSSSSTGALDFHQCNFNNPGNSTTSSNKSAGFLFLYYCGFQNPFTTSGSTGYLSGYNTFFNSAINTTMLIIGGTGQSESNYDAFDTGTASAISIGIGAKLTLTDATISSSNTNVITGLGTLVASIPTFTTNSGINVSNITYLPEGIPFGGTGLSAFNSANALVLSGTTTTNPLQSITSVATGKTLISQGVNISPTFGTAVVSGGGTGVATFSNTSALLLSGTTSTGALQNVASVASNQVLISQGTSTAPVYSAYPQISGLGIGASAGSTAGVTFDGTNFLNNFVTTSSFSPGLTFGGSATGITYAGQTGYYVRIGSVVFFFVDLTLSSKGAQTGNAKITGMPVTSANLGEGLTNIITYSTGFTYVGFAMVQMDNSATTGSFYQNSSGTLSVLTNTAFANNTRLIMTGFYFV